jgi:hypothetical protein
MKQPAHSLGILSIATNVYIQYWETMVRSLDNKLETTQECTAHVFTDQAEKAREIGQQLSKVKVVAHTIPAYRWPDATIRRYEIFTQFSEQIHEDVLMHLDADMLIIENIHSDFLPLANSGKITLIAHPGFWKKRTSLTRRIKSAIKFAKPANGSWETRPDSSAFVEPKMRKVYVCGGIWAGDRDAFLNLSQELAHKVEIDRNNSIIAVWHDESHLNQWAAENEYQLLTPEFCYVAEYRNLDGLTPRVVAVTKEIRTR